jgi:hypothetical protein
MAVLDCRKVPPGQKADSDVVGTEEFPAGSPKQVKAIRQYQEKGSVFVAYEAGCLGFDPCHFLRGHGVDCRIIPANTVFRPGNGKKIKTDWRDAALTAWMLNWGLEEGVGSLGSEAVTGYTFRTGRKKRRGTLSGAGRIWRAA